MNKKIIGIDLGTINSCVAVVENNKPVIIPSIEGERTTPSVVAFTDKGETLVGQAAKRQILANIHNTICPIKCDMGSDRVIKINNKWKSCSSTDIAAAILKKLKQDAEAYLGHTVTDAVISVPSYFTNAQRQATLDAGRIAGFDVKRMLNEATAAALTFLLDKKQEQLIMICDIGGGTFDVSIVELFNGVIEVLAISGNNRFGGDDFDECIMNYLIKDFKKINGIDLATDNIAVQRIREAAERAKIDLSSITTSFINIPYIITDETGPKHLECSLTRDKFEELTAHLIDNVCKPINQAISDSGIQKAQLSKVLLIGGTTRIPVVQEVVRKTTGTLPSRNINLDESVAAGTAIIGGVLNGDIENIILLDVTPFSLGVMVENSKFSKIVERNTTIPTKKSHLFSTVYENQTEIDITFYQGEHDNIQHNELLGKIHLDRISPAKKGIPQIEITFDIDANGVINVFAKDINSGRVGSLKAATNTSKRNGANFTYNKLKDKHNNKDTNSGFNDTSSKMEDDVVNDSEHHEKWRKKGVCGYCGGDLYKPVFKKVEKCKSCGFMYTLVT